MEYCDLRRLGNNDRDRVSNEDVNRPDSPPGGEEGEGSGSEEIRVAQVARFAGVMEGMVGWPGSNEKCPRLKVGSQVLTAMEGSKDDAVASRVCCSRIRRQ